MSEAQFNFIHRGQTFTVRKKFPDVKRYAGEACEFLIDSSDGERHGEVRGSAFSVGTNTVFEATRSDNLARGTDDHVPLLIAGSIAAIVSSGVIDRWHSSQNLTDGGKILYGKILMRDGRLKVELPSLENDARYVVKRRKTC